MSAPVGAALPALSPESERLFLLTLAAVQFSHIVDFMVMMPLGPFLMQGLGIDTRQFGLLVASYSFCAAASGLLAAGFIDRFERKRAMLFVFALFALATLACGLSANYATLLAARGLAGLFGGILGSMVQTLLADAIPFRRRASAGGVVATAFSVSTVAGVPLSLWLSGWLPGSIAFFVLVSGRMIPAMALISSAVDPAWRGAAMSLNSTVQSLAMGAASSLAGFVIAQGADGRFTGYPLVGYVAVAAGLLSMALAGRVRVRDAR